MMEKKRFIFDLDQTLMTADYNMEKEYFKTVLGKQGEIFFDMIPALLSEYESIYPKYEIDNLCRFLTMTTKINFTVDIIKGWIDSFGMCRSEMEDGIIDTLEYLKSKDKSLVVLTNWFFESQAVRIINSGLSDYFDEIYTGDMCLKPRRDAYMMAIDRFSSDECVVIGDDINKDYYGPRLYGIDSVVYDKKDKYDHVQKVKSMKEIKEIY